MPAEKATRQQLNGGARKLIDMALQKQAELKSPYLGVYHWLLALLEQHASMAEAMVNGFQAETVKEQVLEKLQNGDLGTVLDETKVIQGAFELAQKRDRKQAAERDLAAVILIAAGYPVIQGINGILINGSTDKISANHNATPQNKTAPASSRRPTPTLDQFGRDLTAEARAGKLSGMVGREEEIELVIETLCRRTKRNPVLVGPAGVGKTAIVEGLAQRVVQGTAPEPLQNATLIALQPATLVAGAHVSGELENRMKLIIREASQEGILLFIDEIHTIMGAGGMMGTTDVSSMLKPALARGEIACIAATTDDEYRRYIENDAALERRFQPIRVQELSPELTLGVLKSLREELKREDPVEVSDDVLQWLVDFGQQFMRNRYFPDKAVDLLEQVFAYAVAHGKKAINQADAKQVAQRMVGMPVVSVERLAGLEKALKERRMLTDSEIQILINRLQVTLRGLDMRSTRPNAIILLSGEIGEDSEVFCEILAKEIFGASDRVITIDCSRFAMPEDINLLVGAPPGYVGYSDRLPLHRLLQIPWSVLHLERIDACHPRIREVIRQALSDGWIMDGRGKTIYLSDTIVVMTAEVSIQQQRGLGFKPEADQITADDLFAAIQDRVGGDLSSQVDLFSFGLASSEGVSVEWLKDHFLSDLIHRYMKQGIRLTWDDTFMEWIVGQQENQYNEHDWEIWVDRYLTPAIIPYLPLSSSSPVDVKVTVEGDEVKVTTV